MRVCRVSNQALARSRRARTSAGRVAASDMRRPSKANLARLETISPLARVDIDQPAHPCPAEALLLDGGGLGGGVSAEMTLVAQVGVSAQPSPSPRRPAHTTIPTLPPSRRKGPRIR